MKTKLSTKQKNVKSTESVIGGSLHHRRAEATYREMKAELATLKQDVSFREFVGYEMCMKKFSERYWKWLANCS